MKIRFYFILYLLFLINQVAFIKSNVKWKILILGGNGFIGSECVQNLLQKHHSLVLVNRGTRYWDSESRIKPFVKNIKCDRYNGLRNCKEFVALFNETNKLDFVIDFSGYDPEVVEETLHFLKYKARIYIYISTDSVYEVCNKQHSKMSEEIDAQWQLYNNEEGRKDPYGSRKLACEHLVQNQRAQGGIPYVIFRLPDVIGPRDSTHRWWTYQLWIQLHNATGQALLIPQNIVSTQSSFIYVKDVAKVLLQTLNEISEGKTDMLDEIFNLAFDEIFTLKKVLDTMQKILGIHGVQYAYKKNAFHLYPSVYKGPVNISKAKRILHWRPTVWHVAAKETLTFYNQAFHTFQSERDKIISSMLNNIVLPSHKAVFLDAVQELIQRNGKRKELSVKDMLLHTEL